MYLSRRTQNVKSGWRKSLEKGAEHFVDLAGLRENVALARIRDDHIHILVDMDGYSNEGQRIPSVFCNRLAPVQMAYFVYIGTLGSPNVDYIVTDLVASPPSSSGARWGSGFFCSFRAASSAGHPRSAVQPSKLSDANSLLYCIYTYA